LSSIFLFSAAVTIRFERTDYTVAENASDGVDLVVAKTGSNNIPVLVYVRTLSGSAESEQWDKLAACESKLISLWTCSVHLSEGFVMDTKESISHSFSSQRPGDRTS